MSPSPVLSDCSPSLSYSISPSMSHSTVLLHCPLSPFSVFSPFPQPLFYSSVLFSCALTLSSRLLSFAVPFAVLCTSTLYLSPFLCPFVLSSFLVLVPILFPCPLFVLSPFPLPLSSFLVFFSILFPCPLPALLLILFLCPIFRFSSLSSFLVLSILLSLCLLFCHLFLV